ncbi:MAG: hypothetical protein JJE51_00830 [Thermoanaerobaculia bacterium]|nr:hypothetical protein [Thermoanaerobaculia bacterium]
MFLLLALNAAGAVRPISDAERAATEAAAAYLAGGPPAIVNRIASSSPLRKFSAQERLDEIEVRLGPHTGASWELQTVVPALGDTTAVFGISYPSGLDETVSFEMVNESGTYRIADLRILGQRSLTKPAFAAAALQPTTATKQSSNVSPAAAGVLAALLCASAAFAFRFHRAASRILLVTSIAIVAVFVFIDVRRGHLLRPQTVAAVVKPADDSYPRLAALLPMRRAMTEGNADVQAIQPSCTSESCREIGTLWRAQVDLQQMRVGEAKSALKRMKSDTRIPLAEILRGRLALYEGDAVAAAVAYENAVNLGPGRDGLWYETAQALLALGFEDRAAGYLKRLAKVGSREADVYYTLSLLAASKDDDEGAEDQLLSAWRLQPAERSHLVEAAALWSVLRKPKTSLQISLSAPGEATFASEKASTRAIAMPDGAVSKMSGDFLAVSIGEQELLVPGGAALAPAGTTVADAATWARGEDERGLREYDQLVTAARNAGAFTQPALRRRITRTAKALASRNRWSELATLTDSLTPKSEHIPAELFFLRNTALRRLDREMDARRLMEQLAASRVLQRRKDARSLETLAEMLASHDLFDDAIKMYDRALAIRPNPFTDDRVRQIQMNKRLATRYSTHKTEHFDIRYPEDVSPASAINIGNILEAEFKRLQKWVPVKDFKTVSVNVIWWQDFRSTYTGSDFILGFYQGRKITIPFAGVQKYIPPIVGILSHELCHAMLAQATNDQAPRWFQEGLAQRIEMREYSPNAFNMYTDDKLLAISLLDSVMGGSPDPEMISEAYIVSQTIIRYLEAKHGPQSISKLIAAFREGSTNEDAILKVTNQTVAQFDTDLRIWGRTGSRTFGDPPPPRYDIDDSESVRWSSPGSKSR